MRIEGPTLHPLGTGSAGERELALAALEAWCHAAGLGEAALYVPRDGSLRRVAVTGEGAFPRVWSPSASSDGLAALPLEAGAVIVAAAGAEAQRTGSPWLALEASARAVLLADQLREQRFAVSYHGVELQALYDVGLAIASTLDMELLAPEILAHAVALLDARRGALYLARDGRLELADTLGGRARADAQLDERSVQALLTGGEPETQDLLPAAVHLLAVAIGEPERPRGLLVVADKESRSGVGPFAVGDRQTLALFANQAAIALETVELHRQALEREGFERELALASEIQRRLLPTAFPDLPCHQVRGWSRPARQVGGDYYDLLPLDGERLGFVVADVSGKGLPAALMVSTLHAALRLLGDDGDLGALLPRINDYLFHSSAANRFATLFVGRLETDGGRIRYVNAGHNPALVVRGDRSVDRLASSGLPLGLLEGSRWRNEEVELAPGDLLCVYSDGLTEATSPGGEEYGLERLEDLLAGRADAPLGELIIAIRNQLDTWEAGTAQGDDQTVLLVRRRK